MGKLIFGSFGKIDSRLVKYVNKLIYSSIAAIIIAFGGMAFAFTVEPIKRQAADDLISKRLDYDEKDIATKAPLAIVQYGINLLEDELKSRRKTEEQNDTIIKYLKMNHGTN